MRLRACFTMLMSTSWLACGEVQTDTSPDAAEDTLVPSDWIGYELGLSAPHVELIGPATLVDAERQSVDVPVAHREQDASKTADAEDTSWRLVRLDTGLEYRVTMPASDREQLYAAMVGRGETSSFRPAGEASPPTGEPEAAEPGIAGGGLIDPTQAGWSNGTDTRDRLGIADGFSQNHFPFRTIGHFTGGEGCTGTLIGKRTVLTAAHCVATQGVGVNVGGQFRPRSDNTVANKLAPYGTATVTAVWTPWQYTNAGTCQNTGDASQIACNKYDIAVAQLDTDVGLTTGGMGFGYVGLTTLDTYDLFMRGYPSCKPTWADRPSDCPDADLVPLPARNAALWGDTQNCDIGDYWSLDSNNWAREISLDCDGSRGMSGSAVYTYDSPINLGSPVAFGVYSQMLCVGLGCMGDAYPTDVTRITQAYAENIAIMKSLYDD